MLEIDDAVKYFNNCKPKYLRRFSEKTPDGNFIEGWICNKPNRFLGSLVIDTLNGEFHEQFVQSMPKIEYFNDEKDIMLLDIEGNCYNCMAYEKLDGSCLILYPILENGHIVEIVPKTRGMAVADNQFLELFDKCDKSHIWEYYGNNKGNLFFELYGILNQHEIIHYDTGIDLRLIGGYDNGEFFNNEDLLWLEIDYYFKTPEIMFNIRENYIDILTEKYSWYFNEVGEEYLYGLSIKDSVYQIRDFLEYLNKTYIDMYGRLAIEGVVLNCTNSKGYQKYIKIKPKTIENKHRSEHGIPKANIRKEVFKYFDDYGSEVDEIYKNDKNHHTEYINRMLSEDYDEVMIKKSSKKIEKIFMNVWKSKQVPKSIHNICEELCDEYGENGITDCMRMFAQKYPYLKKDANTVYNVLITKFNQRGLEL